jgi:chorismate mutase-like protein
MTILEPLRDEIDALDDEIVALLARRQAIVGRVAELKRAHDIPVALEDRIEAVKRRNAANGAAWGLDPEFVRRLYQLIIDEACALESRAMADPNDAGAGDPNETTKT